MILNNSSERQYTEREVYDAFERAGNPIRRRMARCPCHDDGKPSLSVTVSDGSLLVHCHAGCPQDLVFETVLEKILNRSYGSKKPTSQKVVPLKKSYNFQEAWEAEYKPIEDASQTPYCNKKRVGHHGLKINHSGLESVPMRSEGGLGGIVGIQTISKDGAEKKMAYHSQKKGSAHVVGEVGGGGKIAVCEGYATAASVYEATKIASACAFGVDNVIPVAEALIQKGYEAFCVFDNDRAGQDGANKAEKRGIRAIVPSFDGVAEREDKDNDYNDLARLVGGEAVKRQIDEALSQPLPQVIEGEGRRERKKKATYHDYVALLKQIFPEKEPKRDIMDDGLKVFEKGAWKPVVSRGSRTLLRIEAKARESDFFSVAALLSMYAQYESELAPELLLDIEEWDGNDRIKDFAYALNAEHFSQVQVHELLLDWLVTAYRKALDPSIQNRVLILQGAQGIGKDLFISALISAFSGRPWRPNTATIGGYIANLAMKKNMDESDWGRVLCSHLIVNISEFDKVRGGDASFKSIVTASSASWVPKFIEEVVTRPVRASITASINPKDINADPSGARRYLPIELVGVPFNTCKEGEQPAIDWTLYKEAATNPIQLLAQIVHQAERPPRLSKETSEALRAVQKRLTPSDSVDDAIHDLFSKANEQRKPDVDLSEKEAVTIGGREVQCVFMSNAHLRSLIETASRENGISEKALRSRLKNEGYEKRTKDTRGFYVPIPMKELEQPALPGMQVEAVEGETQLIKYNGDLKYSGDTFEDDLF